MTPAAVMIAPVRAEATRTPSRSGKVRALFANAVDQEDAIVRPKRDQHHHHRQGQQVVNTLVTEDSLEE